jgi:hypothetical protein
LDGVEKILRNLPSGTGTPAGQPTATSAKASSLQALSVEHCKHVFFHGQGPCLVFTSEPAPLRIENGGQPHCLTL